MLFNTVYGKSGGGGGGGWQPGANTVAYYPLTIASTTSDMSGNGHTLTKNGGTFSTYTTANVDCYKTSGQDIQNLVGNVGNIAGYSHTLNVWVYKISGNGATAGGYIVQFGKGDDSHKGQTELISRDSNSKFNYAFWYDDLTSTNTYANGSWHNICCIYDAASTKQYLYIDGSTVSNRTVTYTHNTLYNTNNFVLGNGNNNYNALNGYISKFIIESKIWSADEVLAYYNQTKATYGIS